MARLERAKEHGAALGFRVKSGWATAILLVGPADSARIAWRKTVRLCDEKVPHSRQPYHACLAAPAAKAKAIEKELCDVVHSVTRQSIAKLLDEVGAEDNQVRKAGLVVGSEIDPDKIANDHIRAHALEGRLFRTALVEALAAHQVEASVHVEKRIYDKAAGLTGQTADQLRRMVNGWGKGAEGPWRADEKTASLAAWLALQGK
jgi:hypothetical protein